MFKKIIEQCSLVRCLSDAYRFGRFFAIYGLNVASAQTCAYRQSDRPREFLSVFISWMILILIAISIIMVVMAAFQYVTAGDDTEKTSKARRTLTYSAIGIVVALIAYGFPQIVANVFPRTPR